MSKLRPSRHRQRGFTIMEAIVVIVITGIVGTFVTVFIQLPVRAYLNASARADATDMADNTMRRLTRDLRLALPNSLRVDASHRYIEYIETKAGLRYLAEDDIDTPGSGFYLSWNTATLKFTVVGGVPGGRHAPVPGDSIVVYNLGQDQEPGNAYNCTTLCNRAEIGSIDNSAGTFTLTSNPFAAQQSAGVALMSPGKRFQVVSGPVTYGCDTVSKRLIRYAGYAYAKDQPVPPSGPGLKQAILAENVPSCDFSYATLASQRSGVVGISLTFTPKDASNDIRLLHQIHVDNTP
ncbi:MAG: prepilin-type N-terminal cleavage/methylation domain-containing protein [Pseudomonadota bacterium]